MKITFACKLTMTEDLPDSDVEEVYPVDDIVKELIRELKYCLSEKGTIDISDYSLAVS